VPRLRILGFGGQSDGAPRNFELADDEIASLRQDGVLV